MRLGKHFCATLIVGCLTALPAFGECSLPRAPTKIPDGSSATEPEMVAAMNTLKNYNNDVSSYLKCLEFEAKQNHLSKDEEAKKHNNAVDVLESVASKFNEQVRIFKSKG